MKSEPLSPEQLTALRRLDTCLVANAIEFFSVRLRNEGFANSSIRCLFPQLPPMVGYAVTVKTRCSSPSADGHGYLERTDWWNHVLAVPAPRVVVIQDADRAAGTGSFVGEVHASILQALGCVGVVTNGTVRDVGAVEAMGFQLFASGLAVSHAFTHIVEIGGTVEVGGLTVRPGELLHGDRHGVLTVPNSIAAQVPTAAALIAARERKLIALCRSNEFSLEKLRTLLAERS
ncbi:MAG: RraA family protein [Proteobacteria bacterium]|nr:RraA family protein [Pseudomonadota bacterium]